MYISKILEGMMNKKLTGMGLCLVLATSLCLADNNPFDDTTISVSETKADEKEQYCFFDLKDSSNQSYIYFKMIVLSLYLQYRFL